MSIALILAALTALSIYGLSRPWDHWDDGEDDSDHPVLDEDGFDLTPGRTPREVGLP